MRIIRWINRQKIGNRSKANYTEESSKAIYKQAPVETMKRNYLMFHTMAFGCFGA